MSEKKTKNGTIIVQTLIKRRLRGESICVTVDLQKKIIGFGIVRGRLSLKMTVFFSSAIKMKKYKAFPSFIKEYLCSEHCGIEHIITDERI